MAYAATVKRFNSRELSKLWAAQQSPALHAAAATVSDGHPGTGRRGGAARPLPAASAGAGGGTRRGKRRWVCI
jgi:hypothetical protein